MIAAIQISDPAHLGDLLRSITGKQREQKPFYSFEIPYSYKIGDKEIKDVYRTRVQASSFEEAELIALNRLDDQIVEWRQYGLNSHVNIQYTSKTKKYS